jgi:hypothetical protein
LDTIAKAFPTDISFPTNISFPTDISSPTNGWTTQALPTDFLLALIVNGKNHYIHIYPH